jgi:hypothetical protein
LFAWNKLLSSWSHCEHDHGDGGGFVIFFAYYSSTTGTYAYQFAAAVADQVGKRFSVDRVNLPESVLLCLFPNGLVLSRLSVVLLDDGEGEEDEELYAVDVR